ncbi:hypothetical protein MNBD_NITROSPINAE02-1183 [hydrothermal vent metagenome]|uniref:SnoaL-like domain-containing protein n=1 Tax=hydrothermal vent metagenome TaxID=652676 RepID=A0A3B1CLA1_9ZZZZ
MLSINGSNMRARLILSFAFSLFLALFVYSGAVAFAAEELSEYHTLNIDPVMKKKIGPEMIKEIVVFFKSAELAIEKKRLKDLLDLYSDNYENGSHDKKSAARIWTRIFKTFDDMVSIHNMRLQAYTPESKVMIIRCSGLLLGSPADEKELITIDSWTNEDHILSKESGKWELQGISGKERKRFWFDKPMHPLF